MPTLLSKTRCKLSCVYPEWQELTQSWRDPKSRCTPCWHFQQCYQSPSLQPIDRANFFPNWEPASACRWAQKAPIGQYRQLLLRSFTSGGSNGGSGIILLHLLKPLSWLQRSIKHRQLQCQLGEFCICLLHSGAHISWSTVLILLWGKHEKR